MDRFRKVTEVKTPGGAHTRQLNHSAIPDSFGNLKADGVAAPVVFEKRRS